MASISVPIPGKGNYSVFEDGNIYAPNGNRLPTLTNYEAYQLGQYLRSHRNEKDLAGNPMGSYFNRYAHLIKTGEAAHDKRLKQQAVNTQQKQQRPVDQPADSTNSNNNKTKGSSAGQRSNNNQPTMPKYNYNFGQYYEDNPNDKEHPVAKNYWNADRYSTFRSAFDAAKSGGYGVFTWRGKAYNTMNKGDDATKFRTQHTDYDNFIGNAQQGVSNGIDQSGGWSNSPNYKPEQIAQESNPVATQAQQQTSTQPVGKARLEKFSNDDIRSLGFNNYQGLLNAASNSANSNNNFLKAMYDRYGSDTSKWNQATIENDLGVKGKYRRFGRGDLGDMSRSMMAWVGKNNGEIDRDVRSRTGANGTVYSSPYIKNLYERQTPKITQASTTSSNTQVGAPSTNTSNTTPSTSTQQSTNYNLNTNFNQAENPWLNFGYAASHTQKYQKGGQINMDEQQLQQAFLQYLMQETGAQNEQQLQQVIQQLGEDGLKQAYAQFMQAMQQQQVQAARFGAKLNYIKQLNGQCPDGMQMQYYKVGGRLCKKCMQAKQNGGELENESTNPVDAFKCGRKIKKNQNGRKFPLIETDKNGKSRTKYYKDEATRDSIAANRYNNQDVQVNKPGSYKKNAKGKVQWTPDRTKAPYKKN